MDVLGEWLEVPKLETMDIVALQEVGGVERHEFTQSLPGGSLKEILAREDSELQHCHVVAATGLESHLSQVMLLDKDICDSLCWGCSGKRIVQLCFKHKPLQREIVLIGVHFPHKNDPDCVFQSALLELEHALVRAKKYSLVLIAGDWNTQTGDDRHHQLSALMIYNAFSIVVPPLDTWYRFGTSRCYDFFFYRDCPLLRLPAESVQTTCNTSAMNEIGSDHALISASFLVIDLHNTPKKSSSTKRRSKCHRWTVQSTIPELEDHLSRLWMPGADIGIHDQLRVLRSLANGACSHRKSLRYVDPPYVKDLCKQRREATCPDERAWLVKAILVTRTAAKRQWWQNLEDSAGKGNGEAIRYLRRRLQKPATTSALIRLSGGQSAAAQAVREHTQAVFGTPLSCEDAELLHRMQDELFCSTSGCPLFCFQHDEIREYIHEKIHLRKTSGMLGVSAELIRALSFSELGMDFLTEHCNHLLRDQVIPESYLQAYVCLVPKELVLTVPKQYRPLCLLESMHKLVSGLAYKRLIDAWEKPHCQLGALPGCQVIDCLWLAQTLLYKEYKTATQSAWVLLDLRQAFDNLSRLSVLNLLLRHTPPGLHHEASLLWRLLQCDLHFSWGSDTWIVNATTGVQQGAPPSAGIFGLIVGRALQSLFQEWEHQGVHFQHCFPNGAPLYGWAYVDDIILNIQSWSELASCFSELVTSLQSLGLSVNFDKTVLVLPDRMWSEAELFAAAQPAHPICLCKWRHEGTYLRKPFKPYQPAVTVSEWVLQASGKLAHAGWDELASVLHQCRWTHGMLAFVLINRYIFSKFSWFAIMMEPLLQWTQKLDSLQCTMMCLAMQLYIPGSMKENHAVCLHRLRRRFVYTCLQLNGKFRWLLLLMHRRWKYAGHLLRKPVNSLPLAIITASQPGSVKQATPAPWNSVYTWLVKQLHALQWLQPDVNQPSVQQLQGLASDRDARIAGWNRLEFQHKPELKYKHDFLWPSLRVAFQANVSWKQTVAVCWAADEWWLVWLHEIEGPSLIAFDDDFVKGVGFVRMTSEHVWGLDFVVHPTFLDANLHQLESWIRIVWQEHQCVTTFSVLSADDHQYAIDFAGISS